MLIYRSGSQLRRPPPAKPLLIVPLQVDKLLHVTKLHVLRVMLVTPSRPETGRSIRERRSVVGRVAVRLAAQGR